MGSWLKFCWQILFSIALSSSLSHAQEADDDPSSTVAQDSAKPASPAVANEDSEASNDGKQQLGSSVDVLDAPATTPPILLPGRYSDPSTAKPTAPDVYLLPDRSGKLRRVLGFRYEDFFDAWKQETAGQVIAPPNYAIDHWHVTGSVDEDHSRLTLTFEVAVHRSGWLDIPLQLPELIVQKSEIADQLPGECLTFDKNRHGYVLWLAGKSDVKRKLTLEGLVKLDSNTNNSSVELHLPRATTSDFQLKLPASATDIQAAAGLSVETVAQSADGTDIRLVGQSNPLGLTWKTNQPQTQTQNSPLQVEEITKIQIDRRRATYNARLVVNSFQRPLQQVRVQLPARSELKLVNVSGRYEIKRVPSSASNGHQLVDVRLPEASTEPWAINLTAERPIETFGDAAECRLEGFKVIDAFQQSGLVTLEVDDQLLAYFDIYDEVEQVPVDKTATASAGSTILGQFRYARFPWQIVVFASPRQRRVSVEPRYALDISADEARLDLQYNYQLTGAQIFSLRMALNGWKRTDAPIESGGTIDQNSVVERHDGRLAFRLVDPSTPQLSLKMSFRKDIELGENIFFFPEPTEAYLADGELEVTASQSLQLMPKLTDSLGLSSISEITESQADTSDGALEEKPELIRLRTFLPQPMLVTDIKQRQQEITIEQQTDIEIDQDLTRVTQALDYKVRFKAASQLTLTMPEELVQNESLQLTLDGEPLTFAPLELADAEGDPQIGIAGSATAIVVSLPSPILGEIPMRISYEMPTPELAMEELAPLSFPLTIPLDLTTDHTAKVRAAESVLLSANQRSMTQGWEVVTSARRSEDSVRSLSYRTAVKPQSLAVFAQVESVEDTQLATLDRAWLQSWIAFGRRQERAVFRFHTPNSEAVVQLPEEFGNPEIEVLVDGEVREYKLLDGNRLSVGLDSTSATASHTLELRYQSPVSLPSLGGLSSAIPQLECRVSSAPIYWQLILPDGWQITTAPEHLIPDYLLGWRHFRWGRQPTLSQAELEQHTGAVPSMAPPPLSNEYVFRAFEFPSTIQFTVVRQFWLILACAIGIFLLGLACLHTTLAQNGYFWLALSLTLLAGVVRYPETTILLIELVLIGCLMTLATYVLRRILVPTRSVAAESSGIRIDSSELTEPWREQVHIGQSYTESTTTLKTGGPAP